MSKSVKYMEVVALAAACAAIGCEVTTDSDAAADGAGGPLTCATPQSPRDISMAAGTNAGPVNGPADSAQWLCNVHFHTATEHAGTGACPGQEPGGAEVCAEGEEGVQAGQQIEVHWVYSSCHDESQAPPAPGQGLEACKCEGAVLRVRGQVYVVALEVGDPSLAAPPEGEALAFYTGSTTGTNGSTTECAADGVNWEVAKSCRPVSIAALEQWCGTGGNAFGETHGHEARELVEDEAWLSSYTP